MSPLTHLSEKVPPWDFIEIIPSPQGFHTLKSDLPFSVWELFYPLVLHEYSFPKKLFKIKTSHKGEKHTIWNTQALKLKGVEWGKGGKMNLTKNIFKGMNIFDEISFFWWSKNSLEPNSIKHRVSINACIRLQWRSNSRHPVDPQFSYL